MRKRKALKKAAFFIGVLIVLVVFAIQFVPAFRGEKIDFPFLWKSQEEQVDDGDSAEDVLGASEYSGSSVSSYAAGFSGVPHSKVANLNESVILADLAQGGIGRDADSPLSLEGYANTNIYIYAIDDSDPVTIQNSVTVRITFHTIESQTDSGVIPESFRRSTDYGIRIAPGIGGIEYDYGIMKPLWFLLDEACQGDASCTADIGPETPWLGYAKLEVIAAYSDSGIIAASQAVSTNANYSFGHDGFIEGIDFDDTAPISNGEPVYFPDVGAGYTSGSFAPSETLFTGNYISEDPTNVVFSFYQESGSYSFDNQTVNVGGGELSGGPGDRFRLSELIDLPEGQTWRGWVTVGSRIGASTYTQSVFTADIIKSTNDAGWGQNGLRNDYKSQSFYAQSVAEGKDLAVDSQIAIFNPSNSQTANIAFKVYCADSGGVKTWRSIRFNYGGTWKASIQVSPLGQVQVKASDFIDTLGCAGSWNFGQDFRIGLQIYQGPGNPEVYTSIKHLYNIDKSSPSPVYQGVGQRGIIPETDLAMTDLGEMVYIPAVFANGGSLATDPTNVPLMGTNITGWDGLNYDWDLSVTPEMNVTYCKVLGDYPSRDVVEAHPYPAPPDPDAVVLEYMDPHTEGNSQEAGTFCVDPSACDDVYTFGGYAKYERANNAAFNDLTYTGSNVVGQNFRRTPWWEHTVGHDTYSNDISGVTSLIPADDTGWVEDPEYSSYVFSSAASEASSDFGSGSASAEGYGIYGYSFQTPGESDNAYQAVLNLLELPPTGLDIDDYPSLGIAMRGVENGVYTFGGEVDGNPTGDLDEADLEILEPFPDPQGNTRIFFIEDYDDDGLQLNITPRIIDENLFDEETAQTLMIIVEGDVVIKPGSNATEEDGGDFVDAFVVASGTITIESDDPTVNSEILYWQRDPLYIIGGVFGETDLEIERDLGSYKNTIYPAVKSEWNPAYLIDLREYFKEGSETWDIPGIY